MRKILSLSIAIAVATFVVGSQAQQCFTTTTICNADQYGQTSQTANGQHQRQLQGPPGKRGPLGPAGKKGEQVKD